ncbi:MAG: PEP-CTERM sorting domain-containing protein [Planctomycetales bacterium]|nr:PEP-CTERM sorting domain-containing protein [Planctomycetales bacterium]
MWVEPWTAYFLFEVTDDIAMEAVPGNAWEQDQVEFFMDGDDLEGSAELETFQWWDNAEIFGKFGASRFEGVFEGNGGNMSQFIEDLYSDGFGSYAVAVASETGDNGNYIVEYAVSLEPMFDNGTFDGTVTADVEQIVADSTVVKWTACVSDDDNFGDGTTGRSHTHCYYRAQPDSDWRDTEAFANLTFVGPYVPGGSNGDFDGNGSLDVTDLNALTAATQTGDVAFDLTGDGMVNGTDRTEWIVNLKNTWFGDSNLDGEFNSSDFVAVFTAGKFEQDVAATWDEGDWNGDGKFDSSDFVTAFTDGGFELGPRTGVAAVPEPSSIVLLASGVLAAFGVIRRR